MGEVTVRQGRREPFTVLYKAAIRDTRLTFEMLGFLTYMLDKPPDWEFTISGMARERGVSRDTIRRLVGRLEEVGYLLREQSHDESGHFSANVYVLQERPPLSENTVNGKTRQRENPSTGFPPQLKTNNTKNDYNIPPYNPPKGDGVAEQKRAAKSMPTWKPERFEGFWKFYPRGENRTGAVKAWDKLKPDDELIATIGRALQKLKASDGWQRGIGIPHASVFLRDRRWEDAERVKAAPVARGQPARRLEAPQESGGDGAWIDL